MVLSLAAVAFLLAFIALIWTLMRWRKDFQDPYISFPTLQNFPKTPGRAKLTKIPHLCFFIALSLFSIAFLDFHTRKLYIPSNGQAPVPHEGIAIFFLLDQSGSMREKVPVPFDISSNGELPKIDLLKIVTTRFIQEGLQNDLIGLIAFARGAHVLAPLTLNHQVILKDITSIKPMNSAETDGTAIGYAIYKTASMIAATRHYAQELETTGKVPYEIKGSAIVVVTDGLQAPSPLDKGKRLRNMDIPEAAAFAKEQNIRLYIINVDPSITLDEFAPHRHIMQKATELTGGKFIAVGGDTSLTAVYGDIAKLEKGHLFENDKEVTHPVQYVRGISLYPWLIAIGLIFLVFGVFFETISLRRVP